MPTRIAINGLGRIGRALLRIAEVRDDLEVAAVNDLVPGAVLARPVARDTLHGPLYGWRDWLRYGAASGRHDNRLYGARCWFCSAVFAFRIYAAASGQAS